MSEITRRDALGRLAAAFAASAAIDTLLARDAHAFLQSAVVSAPKALSTQQFRTLERLTDLIIPVENGTPGALGAGVPAWIDSLVNVNAELKTKYDNGLGWLDTTMRARSGSDFAGTPPQQQTALLDLIAFRKNASPELNPGIDFFALVRRMTVDGFYTSDVGIRDIIPNGRPPLTEFVVPQESVAYVISQSPFK
jgi:gluconate 2-dehydrogenase gamma chain